MFHVKQAALTFSPSTEQRLRDFARLLLQWNPRINLISPADEAAVWERHVLDSAQLAALLPGDASTLTDLGSGAGFPGLVLAIVTGRRVHLVEADKRKSAFLREAARLTQVDVTVHVTRAESVQIERAAAITARALAPLPLLLRLAVPLLEEGGVCLFPKGRAVADELTAAQREWNMQVERFPSRTSPDATILRLREIHPVTPPG